MVAMMMHGRLDGQRKSPEAGIWDTNRFSSIQRLLARGGSLISLTHLELT